MVPEFQNMKMTFFRYCSYFSAFMLLKLFTNRSNLCAINFYRPFNQLVFEIWILSTFLRFIEQSIFYCVIKNVMTICLCTSALVRHIEFTKWPVQNLECKHIVSANMHFKLIFPNYMLNPIKLYKLLDIKMTNLIIISLNE